MSKREPEQLEAINRITYLLDKHCTGCKKVTVWRKEIANNKTYRNRGENDLNRRCNTECWVGKELLECGKRLARKVKPKENQGLKVDISKKNILKYDHLQLIEMAKILKVNPVTVRKYRKKYGLPPKPRNYGGVKARLNKEEYFRLLNKGLSENDIREKFKYSESHFRVLVKKFRA